MFFGAKIQKIIQICKYLRHFFTILVENFIFKYCKMRKAAGSHGSTACAKYMILISNYALPVTTKPVDAYTCYYVEYHGYTGVQGYAVEPRHVTFGRKTHRYNLIFVNGVGGGNYSIAP